MTSTILISLYLHNAKKCVIRRRFLLKSNLNKKRIEEPYVGESQLYSFLDRNNDFLIHFFEGKKLIQELVLIHELKDKGFLYLRDLVLSTQPMISLLKPNEGFGIYIDSKNLISVGKLKPTGMEI